jgi:acyl-CoA thioesterase YciA
MTKFTSSPRRVGTLIETLHPKDTNPDGQIFGGVIMSIMDKTAGVAGWGYAKKRVVTASAERITFHSPVLVGEVVKSTATVVYTGRTSMDVEVVVEVENLIAETSRLGASGIFTMVALNDEGRPVPIPQWVPVNKEDLVKFNQAKDRRRQRRQKE